MTAELKQNAMLRAAERAAIILGQAKAAGITEGVILAAFVGAIAAQNPRLARITLAAIENGIDNRAFDNAADANDATKPFVIEGEVVDADPSNPQ